MLRTIFGKQAQDSSTMSMASASTISLPEFQDALSRYPALIKSLSKPQSSGSLTLEQLDRYRYIDAPASFSKTSGRYMEIEDVKKLVDWKLRHGTYRPSLPKLVASNSSKKIQDTTQDAFAHYANNPSDIVGTIKALSTPLRGVGPATASLLLSIHDPKNIIFFSDEAYKWLCTGGKKTALKYDVKEFDDLQAKANALMKKLKVTPVAIEQVAFVIIKENEPVRVPKPKPEPSGLPRGRPRLPESEKKAKKATVPGRGRGRPRTVDTGLKADARTKPATPSGRGRGRPRKTQVEDVDAEGEDENDEEGEDELDEKPSLHAGKRKAVDEKSPSSRGTNKRAKA